MLKLIGALVVIGAAAYFFPQIYEEAGGPCQALEKKIIRVHFDGNPQNTALAGMVLAITDGGLGAEVADEEYGDLPKPLACAVTYYDFPERITL